MDNKQALGYMLMACKQLGMDKEKTRKLFLEMNYSYDIYTAEEAEKKGHEWYYSLDDITE